MQISYQEYSKYQEDDELDLSVLFSVVGAITIISHFFCHIVTYWVLFWKIRVEFTKVSNPEMGSHVLVKPSKAAKKMAICAISREFVVGEKVRLFS